VVEGAAARAAGDFAGRSAGASSNVFQASHPGQRPSQRGDSNPHDEQKKTDRALATMTLSRSQKDNPVHFPRLDALDGLRGIAIALVVWYHLWQVSWLDPHIALGQVHVPLVFIPISGFLGVELFFFLSAFVLSYPFVRAELSGEIPPSLTHFVYRRFIKIMPSYVLSLIAVVALSTLPGAKESWGANIDWATPRAAFVDLGAHLTFTHTFFYDTYASINGVLWTLGIEVQYYVVFPLLIVIFLRAPLAVAAFMTVIAIGYRVHVGECCRLPVFDHNLGQLLGFFDFFAAGMLAAYVYGRLQTTNSRLAQLRPLWTLAAAVGFLWIGVLFWNLTSHRWDDEFADWWMIRNGTYYSIAIFLAAIGSLFALPAWRRLIANPVLVFLAVISYNLYLWHQVVFRWVATWPFIPHAPGVTRGDPTFAWITTICGLAIALAVATLVTYAVERPLLRMDPDVAARRFSLAFRRVAPSRSE
jgi:peptidoglycan/LPS O-acetylase OafA/YrhL